MKTWNWGILGPGKIAHKMVQDLQRIPRARLHAVGSRSLERAREFAQAYTIPHAFGSYEELAACPDLDVVYIATPHHGHFENTLMCLGQGVAVLCEKPLAINARESQQMIEAARSQQVFLMEAMWTRFLPQTLHILELIEDGAIGDVLAVKADFGFAAPVDPDGRLFNLELGGGALLDIGIYPAFLSLLLLGKPDDIQASAILHKTGVDVENGVVLKYRNGQMAHLHSTLRSLTKTEAFIYGTQATIHIHTRWHEPSSFTIIREGEAPELHTFTEESHGYLHEAREVMHCLEEGLTESPHLPLSFSQDLMELLDDIRIRMGLTYPQDREG